MKLRRIRTRDSQQAEWRRLRRAIVFFVGCLAVLVALYMIGLYH